MSVPPQRLDARGPMAGMNTPARPEPVVTVRGAWQGDVAPEVARIRIEVIALGADRSQTLAQVSERVQALRTAVSAFGDAVERVDASALRVSVRLKDRKPTERVSGYVAEVELTVVVVEFAVLGDLLLRLAEHDLVTVRGPYWALRPDSGVYRDARTAAVRDARAIAEEYAAAAGSRLTGLVEISDSGLGRDWDDRVYSESAMSMEVGSSERSDQVTFDVEPAPQAVRAAVQARFTLSQPDFT